MAQLRELRRIAEDRRQHLEGPRQERPEVDLVPQPAKGMRGRVAGRGLLTTVQEGVQELGGRGPRGRDADRLDEAPRAVQVRPRPVDGLTLTQTPADGFAKDGEEAGNLAPHGRRPRDLRRDCPAMMAP